jgi:hypothetical protein
MSTRALQPPRAGARLRMPSLAANGLTIAVAALGVASLLVLAAATGMVADSWLALVGGREIAAHGLPARDHLAAVTLGRRWTDQQWLGQLALYELHRAVRNALPVVVALLAVLPSTLGAVRLGRRASTDGATAAIALIALLPFLVPAAQPRTQSLAYPAFVGLLALLLRRPQTWSGRVGAIAVVAVWANLHGSVLLGAGAASLMWLQDVRSHRLRTASLLVATWLAALCSPYALELPAYYRSTVSNSGFAEVLSQWQPLGFSPHAVPTWLLIVATVWMIGRSSSRLWSFEPALLLALVLLTLHSVRASSFLALAAMALLPRLARHQEPERAPSTAAVPLALASLAIGALFTAAAITHLRFSPYEPRAAAAALDAAGPGTVFAPLELGDWLLWTKPALRGRVAADARAELLTQAELRQYGALWHGTDGWRRATAGYRAFVLSPTGERSLVRRLTAAPAQFGVVYRDPKLVVFLRHPSSLG